jgi:two-component system, LytTR family, response regulator
MTQKIKAIIVDDEKHSRTLLKELIELAELDVEIIGEGENLPNAIELIYSLKPDLVFLDIEMPGYSGLQINDFIKSEREFDIIFVTAYNQFAIEALRMAAFDYLLKPMEVGELTASIGRFKTKRSLNINNSISKKLDVLTNNLATVNHKKIVIQSQQGMHYFETDKIYYLEASSMYTIIHLETGQFVASKPIKEFEEILGPNFFRIHRSYIINCNYVIKYSNKEGAMITLINNTALPISRVKREEFIRYSKNQIL